MPHVAIDPTLIYRESDLITFHGFSFNELLRARKAGKLPFVETTRGRRFYVGANLLAWLRGEEPKADGQPL